MPILEKLEEWPKPDNVTTLLRISVIVIIAIFPAMQVFFMQSGDIVNIIESQLSFSGVKMKWQYFIILFNNGIDAYRLAQILDYIFMFGYGTVIFCIAIKISRNFESSSRWYKVSLIIAFLGIASAGLDAFENAFILLTLTDPLCFPDWWTVAHSCFALPKYIGLLTSIAWAVIAVIKIRR